MHFEAVTQRSIEARSHDAGSTGRQHLLFFGNTTLRCTHGRRRDPNIYHIILLCFSGRPRRIDDWTCMALYPDLVVAIMFAICAAATRTARSEPETLHASTLSVIPSSDMFIDPIREILLSMRTSRWWGAGSLVRTVARPSAACRRSCPPTSRLNRQSRNPRWPFLVYRWRAAPCRRTAHGRSKVRHCASPQRRDCCPSGQRCRWENCRCAGRGRLGWW